MLYKLVFEPDTRLSYTIHVLKTLKPNEVVEIIKIDLVMGAGVETSY